MTKEDLDNTETTFSEDEDTEPMDDAEVPLDGSPLYPRIYVGDSALPLQGQFPQSETVDDNVTRTWTGLLTSFYG